MRKIVLLSVAIFLSTLSANSDIENLSITTKTLAEAVDVLSRTQLQSIEERNSIKESIKEVLFKQNEIESSLRKNSERIARLESAKNTPQSVAKEVYVEPIKKEKLQRAIIVKPGEDTEVSEIIKYIKSDSQPNPIQNVGSVNKADIEKY